MRMRTRKLVGTILLLAALGVYLPLAMLVGANHVAGAGTLVQVSYFLIAGMIWVLPAGLILRWMARPDKQ